MASKSDYDRFSLTLPAEINEWLYQFTLDIKKSGGYRVPKTLVVRAFIRAIQESGIEIDIGNIRTENTKGIGGKVSSDQIENMLKNRILKAISNVNTQEKPDS